ncbi:MAG TPA: hypothetical protein VK658_18255 [Chryseolinea sp.]|nr:hypothetical protein [Chryseolinea sp.]
MSKKTDKDTLKGYFRSGSRPTQKQFQELIDSCYNGALTSAVSGYQLLTDSDSSNTMSLIKRESGKTHLVPQFVRINVIHRRMYHYALPCIIGPECMLDTIALDISLPTNASYKVKDGKKEVNITQSISLDGIRVLNGSEEIIAATTGIIIDKSPYELSVKKKATEWLGIGIDIAVSYDIKSDIAVSDQLNISIQGQNMLLHTFGGVVCNFTADE